MLEDGRSAADAVAEGDGFGLQPTTLVEDGSAAAAATAPRTPLFVPSLGTPRGVH